MRGPVPRRKSRLVVALVGAIDVVGSDAIRSRLREYGVRRADRRQSGEKDCQAGDLRLHVD